MTDLERFNDFLGTIDLAAYREKYQPIKLVELDMPKHIRPLDHIYREYWTNKSTFPGYEDFYNTYATELQSELEEFRRVTRFSEETFKLGLPARIYRAWASLITQIQGGYVAEELHGQGSVDMSTELDYAGIDIRITTGGVVFNIQVKKETLSREVRTPQKITKRDTPITQITYEIPGCDPRTPTGKLSVPFRRWEDKWLNKLERLDNGFIIFLPGMFSLDYIHEAPKDYAP